MPGVNKRGSAKILVCLCGEGEAGSGVSRARPTRLPAPGKTHRHSEPPPLCTQHKRVYADISNGATHVVVSERA